MKKRSLLYCILGSFCVYLLGSGFAHPLISTDHLLPKDHYQDLISISSASEDDPENEDICGLYDADCEETNPINSKNVEIDLVRAESAKVAVIFFWMQDCAHCEEVLNSLLPEMYLTFGDQVYFYPIELKEISEVDVFYQMAGRLGVPKNNIGVPLMIIGDQVLDGNQIDNNLEKSINTSLQKSTYSFVAIPEFEEKLPIFLKNKQVDLGTTTSDHNYPMRTPILLALIIGLPLLVIAGVFFFKISKKKNLL